MTLPGRGATGRSQSAGHLDHEPEDWVVALTDDGPTRDAALTRLHALLVRAARHQVWRMRAQLGDPGPEHVDELALQAADEAMVALLSKLSSFQGRSRFTTWAFKFAILQAATEVRSHAWRNRQVPFEDARIDVDLGPSPEDYAEAADLADAVSRAIQEALTPHQRRVMLALLVDEVPIDVLAERLGTTRNALYKTLHDGRVRVRAHLDDAGFLEAATGRRDVR
jgi:RNA polymerase sigma-70 factor (ECF subfamily)